MVRRLPCRLCSCSFKWTTKLRHSTTIVGLGVWTDHWHSFCSPWRSTKDRQSTIDHPLIIIIIIIIIAPLTIVREDQWGDWKCLNKACQAAITDGGSFTVTAWPRWTRVKMTVRWKPLAGSKGNENRKKLVQTRLRRKKLFNEKSFEFRVKLMRGHPALVRKVFITYIHPTLEFNSNIWNPTKKYLIDKLKIFSAVSLREFFHSPTYHTWKDWVLLD